MADIKRPHYFPNQFLIEADFDDEQDYQVRMRRRHNAAMHTAGVVSGLTVTRLDDSTVSIGPGSAVDGTGREIVLDAETPHRLQSQGGNQDVFVTIAGEDVLTDPLTENGVSRFTRVTQRPVVSDSTALPADQSLVPLARIRLNASGTIDPGAFGVDQGVRTLASAAIAPRAITSTQLAAGAVTPQKLSEEAKPITIHASGAVGVTLDDPRRRATIGESHSARTDNPHAVTVLQIDTQGGELDRIVAQINAGTGFILRERIAPAPVLAVSGVVAFENLSPGFELFSDEIDPGFGAGAMCIQLAAEDEAPNATVSGDFQFGRLIKYRAEVNRNTGRFKVFVTRIGAPGGPGKVRWFAFRTVPQLT